MMGIGLVFSDYKVYSSTYRRRHRGLYAHAQHSEGALTWGRFLTACVKYIPSSALRWYVACRLQICLVPLHDRCRYMFVLGVYVRRCIRSFVHPFQKHEGFASVTWEEWRNF